MAEELAWAAGFYDGEGCTGCYFFPDFPSERKRGSTRKRASVRATVVQTSLAGRELLERFRQAVGVGRIYGPRRRKDGWAEKYEFVACGKDAARVLDLLAPYLSAPKTEQAVDAFTMAAENRAIGHVLARE